MNNSAQYGTRDQRLSNTKLHSDAGFGVVPIECDEHCHECTVKQSRTPEAHTEATWPFDHIAPKR
jgi:hypothetical protein